MITKTRIETLTEIFDKGYANSTDKNGKRYFMDEDKAEFVSLLNEIQTNGRATLSTISKYLYERASFGRCYSNPMSIYGIVKYWIVSVEKKAAKTKKQQRKVEKEAEIHFSEISKHPKEVSQEQNFPELSTDDLAIWLKEKNPLALKEFFREQLNKEIERSVDILFNSI